MSNDAPMFGQKDSYEIAQDIERGAKAMGYPMPQRLGVVPNSVVLMFVRGWQGGTDTQIAAELGVTREDIHGADYARMGELMRLAQAKRRELIGLYGTEFGTHEKICTTCKRAWP